MPIDPGVYFGGQGSGNFQPGGAYTSMGGTTGGQANPLAGFQSAQQWYDYNTPGMGQMGTPVGQTPGGGMLGRPGMGARPGGPMATFGGRPGGPAMGGGMGGGPRPGMMGGLGGYGMPGQGMGGPGMAGGIGHGLGGPAMAGGGMGGRGQAEGGGGNFWSNPANASAFYGVQPGSGQTGAAFSQPAQSLPGQPAGPTAQQLSALPPAPAGIPQSQLSNAQLGNPLGGGDYAPPNQYGVGNPGPQQNQGSGIYDSSGFHAFGSPYDYQQSQQQQQSWNAYAGQHPGTPQWGADNPQTANIMGSPQSFAQNYGYGGQQGQPTGPGAPPPGLGTLGQGQGSSLAIPAGGQGGPAQGGPATRGQAERGGGGGARPGPAFAGGGGGGAGGGGGGGGGGAPTAGGPNIPPTQPNTIGGQLPWNPSAGDQISALAQAFPGLNLGPLGSSYQNAYQSALAQNQALYNNILGGYQQTQQAQTGAQNAIQQGYPALTNQIMGTLGLGPGGGGWGVQGGASGNWGVAAPAAQAIQDTLAQQQGQVTQNMTSSGLGNTTVANEMQRGPALDAMKAYGALGANLAQTAAGYQGNIGMAGLNYANQANMQNTAEANQALGWMNTIQAPYPNAAAYGQLAQGAGQYALAQQNAAQNQQMFNAQLALQAQALRQGYGASPYQSYGQPQGGGGGGPGAVSGMSPGPYAGGGSFGGGGGGESGYGSSGGDFGGGGGGAFDYTGGKPNYDPSSMDFVGPPNSPNQDLGWMQGGEGQPQAPQDSVNPWAWMYPI